MHTQWHSNLFLRVFNRCRRITEGRARREVEGDCYGRELALVIDGQRRRSGLKMCESAQWHRATTRRAHVNILQLGWILLELRHRFQNHMILIQLREERRNLPLTEGVVERIVNGLRRDSQARRCHAVDDERRL